MAGSNKQRRVILIEEPLCRFCAETGLVAVVATEIAHIDGDPFNRDRDNCRALCRPCHLLRTAQEQAFGKDQWRPKWLRPSTITLTIVCGPPASGNSLYVHRHRDAGDLVIDLDMIASVMSGSSLHG